MPGAPAPEDLKIISRKASGPPATGSGVRSAMQQKRLWLEAFDERPVKRTAGKAAKSKVRA